MKEINFKKIREKAKKQSKNNTSIENLLFISELLGLESDKYKKEKQDGISLDLMNLSYKVASLINEIF